jgi:Flp pilus assembly protein TadG
MNWRRPAAGQPRDRGAAAVEFALLLPVLILLLFGIVEFGRALNAQITITQAAREGARLASLGTALATVQTKTMAAATGLTIIQANVTEPNGACAAGAGATGGFVIVKVAYTYTFIAQVGAIGKMYGPNSIGSTLSLTAQGYMPCET